MSDTNETKKTEIIGYLPKDLARDFPGWRGYADSSSELGRAIEKAAVAKDIIRMQIKAKLDTDDDIDFTMEEDRIRVFKVLKVKNGKGRRPARNLVDKFKK